MTSTVKDTNWINYYVFDPLWRRKSQDYNEWGQSNLIDRFVDNLRIKAHTRKQLGYIGLVNNYPREMVTAYLNLLPTIPYIQLDGDLYTCTLPEDVNPEDIW